MDTSKKQSVQEYLRELPPERRETIAAVRRVILAHLPKGYKETMQYGMISYIVPPRILRETYNGQPLCYVALAAQKNYYSLYLMNVYGNKNVEEWFVKEYQKSGKRLDIGKSCLRFKALDDLPLELIGRVIARTPLKEFVASYTALRREKR